MIYSYLERFQNPFQFSIFNGDTAENFSQCAFFSGGKVYYRKDRQSLFKFPNLYVDREMYQPVNMAIDKAFELGQTPLVMEILLSKLSREARSNRGKKHLILSSSKNWSVARIWVPKDLQRWREINGWNNVHDAYRNTYQQRVDIFLNTSPLTLLA